VHIIKIFIPSIIPFENLYEKFGKFDLFPEIASISQLKILQKYMRFMRGIKM
jgi:hypothetical protein